MEGVEWLESHIALNLCGIGALQCLNENTLFAVQAYSGTPLTEEKEKIVWVRFENADLNGMTNFWDVCIKCVLSAFLELT